MRTAWRGVLIFAGFAAMVLAGGYILVGYLPSYLVREAGLSPAGVSVANVVTAAVLAAGRSSAGSWSTAYLRGSRPPPARWA